ncbi:MAG: hypothetical protein NZX77_22420, partial [Polyangiaceae bacterium]|nr:hypothetical protein [Polyangiaceae bacterium]
MPSRRILAVHVLVLLVIVLVGGQACSRKGMSLTDEQDFAPPPRFANPVAPPVGSSTTTTDIRRAAPTHSPPTSLRGATSAGLAQQAPVVAGCVSAVPTEETPSKEKEPEEPEPVDLAIA